MCDMTINIYGGNNQILPNATEAVQNLYVYDHANKLQVVQTTSDALFCLGRKRVAGSLNKLQVVQTTSDALSSEAEKLSRYIDKDHIPAHFNKIHSCNNATDLAQVVVSLLDQEPKLTEETIVKESFIQCLLPFAINITTGRSVNNIRARINDALEARHRSRP